MKPNSKWILTFAGLTVTAALLVLSCTLVNLHPIHRIEYVALLVNCSGGFEAQAARTEHQQVSQYSVCLDRSGTVEASRSVSQCADGNGGNCGEVSAKEEISGNRDTFHHSRL